jgi:hypothetical protein
MIIVDKELHASLYKDLNDPMEGCFRYDPNIGSKVINHILAGKSKTYICSLSKSNNIGLMWSHYADNNMGCCIEVAIRSSDWTELDVTYQEELPLLKNYSLPEDILKVKSRVWSYEQETRFIKNISNSSRNHPSLQIQIHTIWIGYKVKKNDFDRLKRLINCLDSDIKVLKMNRNKLDYGIRY